MIQLEDSLIGPLSKFVCFFWVAAKQRSSAKFWPSAIAEIASKVSLTLTLWKHFEL